MAKVIEQYRIQEIGFRDKDGDNLIKLRRFYDESTDSWDGWYITTNDDEEVSIDYYTEEEAKYLVACFKEADKVFNDGTK